MESFYSLFAISLQFILFHQVLCESQEVYFEIKDGNFNEIIFIGEKNITLICHVSNILHADVTITKVGEGSVATNRGIGNCLEYNIQQVTEQNGGNYSCTSRYGDKNTGGVVEMSRMLSLIVRDNHSPSCLRNGTGLHQAYSVGDVLSLSCYCDVSIECNWIQSVERSKVGRRVPPMDVLQHNGKIIRRIVVGPLTSLDVAIRYDCSSGSSVDERCSIGPANVSINDVVSLSIPQSYLSEACLISVPSSTESMTEEVSTTVKLTSTDQQRETMSEEESATQNNKSTDQQKSMTEDYTNFIIFLAVALASSLLIAAAIFAVFSLRLLNRNKHGEIDAAEKNENDNQLKEFADVNRQPDNLYYSIQENPTIGSSYGSSPCAYYSTKIKHDSHTYDEPQRM
ncbi:hypothetical protein BSL78_06992 [Apostichopus japonicus]|uniref:Ig-like domain-containing protein n=1 Tax=Stichopus japonicus TaxID=307972 RepID=A0A2G8L763_STIJA|nr:hypothetical protein BSL78_06992 [Apostichopus japonicus]